MGAHRIFFAKVLFLRFRIYFSVSEYSFHFFAVWYIFPIRRLTKSIKPVAQKWSDSMTYTGRIRVKPLFKSAAFISDIGMLVETRERHYCTCRIELPWKAFHLYSINIDFEKKSSVGQ